MKKDLYLSFVVLFQMIVTTIQLLLPLLGVVSTETAATYRVAITLLTYLPGVVIVMQRRLVSLLLAFASYVILLLVSYEFFPESHRFIESSQAVSLTPIAILTILFMMSIRDFSNFEKMLLLVSRIAVFISLLYVVAHTLSPFRELDDTYSMSFGYSMLLPAMFLFTQQGYFDKTASLLLFVLILLDGSRGPVLVLGIFYVYYTLFMSTTRTKMRMILVGLVAITAAVVILPRLESFQNSRTIYLLQEGELVSHDSGRNEKMYSVVTPHIMERPITGWGVGADRYFLDGAYSHNIFLEVYLHYGIFIGSFLFLYLFGYCLKTYFSPLMRKVPLAKEMFVMMFLYGLIPKLFSGSYLIDFSFAIFMGYLLSVRRHLRRSAAISA